MPQSAFISAPHVTRRFPPARDEQSVRVLPDVVGVVKGQGSNDASGSGADEMGQTVVASIFHLQSHNEAIVARYVQPIAGERKLLLSAHVRRAVDSPNSQQPFFLDADV